MKLIMLSSVSASIFYGLSSHPVILMVVILFQTIMICLISWTKLKTSWMAYILFLIFLGGLMVLFIYITSLASNELMSLKMTLTPLVFLVVMMTLLFMIKSFNFQLKTNPNAFFLKTIMYMYSWNSSILIITTMVYLLLTLIIVVKISNKFEAPLKNLIFK